MDIDSKEQLQSEVYIELNNTIIHTANLSSTAWTEFAIPYNSTIKVICRDNFHYTSITELSNYKQSSSIVCNLKRHGELRLEQKSPFTRNSSKINLILHSTGYSNNLVVCLSWSGGIISTWFNEFESKCEMVWYNWTRADLPIGYYQCPMTREVQRCKGDTKYYCSLFQATPPERLKTETRRCYYTGISLEDDKTILELMVKPLNINGMDHIDLYVIDQDKAKVSKHWLDSMEYDGKDSGIKDLVMRLKLKE